MIQRVDSSACSSGAGVAREPVNSFPATLLPRQGPREEGEGRGREDGGGGGGREEGRGVQSRRLRLPDEDAEMSEITRGRNPQELQINPRVLQINPQELQINPRVLQTSPQESHINPRENLCDTAREVFKLLNVHSSSETTGGVTNGVQVYEGRGGVPGYRGDIPSGPRDSMLNVLQNMVNTDIHLQGSVELDRWGAEQLQNCILKRERFWFKTSDLVNFYFF